MVKGYTLRAINQDDRHVFKRALDPTLTDRVPLAADFAVVYALSGFAGAAAAMILAALIGTFDRSLAIPALWTALPLLGTLGLYLGHRRWRVKRAADLKRLDGFTRALKSGEVSAKIYNASEALIEKLPHSYQINVLVKTNTNEILWLPSDLCPQQGKQLNRVSAQIELLKSPEGHLMAAWPLGGALAEDLILTAEGLSVAVENQIKGAYDNGEVSGVAFENLKETFLKKVKKTL